MSGDVDDRVIQVVMNDIHLPQGKFAENNMMISLREVWKEGGGSRRRTWRTWRVPEWTHECQGHP